jgi:hypothetical protein
MMAVISGGTCEGESGRRDHLPGASLSFTEGN